jgi:hypothetical protein
VKAKQTPKDPFSLIHKPHTDGDPDHTRLENQVELSAKGFGLFGRAEPHQDHLHPFVLEQFFFAVQLRRLLLPIVLVFKLPYG